MSHNLFYSYLVRKIPTEMDQATHTENNYATKLATGKRKIMTVTKIAQCHRFPQNVRLFWIALKD
jgi:hypothetical protein